jgi:hypothetical protein
LPFRYLGLPIHYKIEEWWMETGERSLWEKTQ